MGPIAWTKRMWRGEEPLALAFWQYGIVFGLVIDVAHILLVWAVNAEGVPGVVLVATYLIPVPYYSYLVSDFGSKMKRSNRHRSGRRRFPTAPS